MARPENRPSARFSAPNPRSGKVFPKIVQWTISPANGRSLPAFRRLPGGGAWHARGMPPAGVFLPRRREGGAQRTLMAHESRIGAVCIDCEIDDLTEAVAFWSAALGREGKIDERGKYAVFDDHRGYPKVLLQAVDHPPRVHLDIEATDKEAEVARMEAIGARVVERVRSWIVMEAPTGHRFCIVDPQGDDWPEAGSEDAALEGSARPGRRRVGLSGAR